MSAKIEIDGSFISSYLDGKDYDGAGREIDSLDRDSERIDSILSHIEKTLELGLSAFDESAKEKGLPGLGRVKSSDLSQLSIIVAEKRLSPEMLAKAPEAALLTVLSGIGMNNFYVFKKLQSEGEKSGD